MGKPEGIKSSLTQIENAATRSKRLVTEVSLQLEALQEALLPLKERSITARELQTRVWQVWGHTRINKDSLDSAEHCKVIRETMEAAVGDVARRIESLSMENSKQKEVIRSLRRELRDLKKKEQK